MSTKLPRGTLDKLWNDPANWYSIGFYFCKDDPRVIVPKRKKWAGWTLNFSHPTAWVDLVIGITLAVVPALLLKEYGNMWLLTLWLAILVGSSVVTARIRSSPARYEES